MICELRLAMPQRKLGKVLPKGTRIEHKDAHWLVKQGVANPVDEECKAACPGWTPAKGDELEALYRKLVAGKLTGDKRYDTPDKEDD